jgi:hypothetical protein
VLIVIRLHRPRENTYEGHGRLDTYPCRESIFEIEKNQGGTEGKAPRQDLSIPANEWSKLVLVTFHPLRKAKEPFLLQKQKIFLQLSMVLPGNVKLRTALIVY